MRSAHLHRLCHMLNQWIERSAQSQLSESAQNTIVH